MKYLILGFSVAKFENVLNTEEKETILMLFWAGFSHIKIFFSSCSGYDAWMGWNKMRNKYKWKTDVENSDNSWSSLPETLGMNKAKNHVDSTFSGA